MVEQTPKDDLTGFFLRKDLRCFLEELLRDAAINKKNFSLILIDVDHFKRFNDKFGHPFGDEVLKYMASILRLSSAGKPCHFFRYGGDEFIVVLPNKDPKEALSVASQFKYNMARRPFMFKGKFRKITTSCGIASFPSDGETMPQLIKKADEAMYFSKHHGRNTTTLAGKIGYLKLRNALLIVIGMCVAFVPLLVSYQFLKRPINKAIDTLRALQVSVSPINSDRIILKNGTVLNGKIMEETNMRVILSIYRENGMMNTVNLEKLEIEKIEYGEKTSSRQRYEGYMKLYPNPHRD